MAAPMYIWTENIIFWPTHAAHKYLGTYIAHVVHRLTQKSICTNWIEILGKKLLKMLT